MKRRHFLQTLSVASLGANSLANGAASAHSAETLPATGAGATDDAFWTALRKRDFLLPNTLAYLNNGTLGVPPRPVIAAINAGLEHSGSLSGTALNRWGSSTEQGNARTFVELRSELATFFGCPRDELTLTQNSTAGLEMLANGLALNDGDEVVLTDQEHGASIHAWENRRAPGAIIVKTAVLPITPSEPRQLVDAVLAAVTPRTRVLLFSGITTKTGLRLPVAEIVAAVRDRRIITVVDGAHLPGQVAFNLNELGCDYLVASPHKWMFAPSGCGLLYGRGDRLARLADTLLPGYAKSGDTAAENLMKVGTNNGAVFDGYSAALTYLRTVGPAAVYARIKHLSTRKRAEVATLPDVILQTPEDSSLYAGMVSFSIRGKDLRTLGPYFLKHDILVAARSNGIRVSSHIHTRPDDLARFFDVLRAGLKTL